MVEESTWVVRLTPRIKVRLVLLFMVLLLLPFLAFYFGIQQGLGLAVEYKERSRGLSTQVNQQSIELNSLQAEIVRIEKAAQIDRLAAESVRKDVLQYQQEAADLQRDVEFYRGLMAPDELQRGLTLHAFNLYFDELTGHYNFKGVMTNIGGRGSVIKGSLDLTLHAYEGDTLQKLSLSKLPDYRGGMPIKLRFRFFQNIEGSFKLPDNLRPTHLIASANIKDVSGELFNASYDWAALTSNL